MLCVMVLEKRFMWVVRIAVEHLFQNKSKEERKGSYATVGKQFCSCICS